MNPSPTASASRAGGRRFFADTSVSAPVAGLAAMTTGYPSSPVLLFQAGRAAPPPAAHIPSWIGAPAIGPALPPPGLSPRLPAPLPLQRS
ncbi:hypothetical protein DWU95_22440, partial [Burkholderia contaminans]